MEHENFERQMFLTNKKEKIFNVRKVHYKQFDHQKCKKYMIADLKPSFSPFQMKQHSQEPLSTKTNKKGGQYNYQVAIISSTAYKELTKKYNNIKEQHGKQKQIRLQQMRMKQEQLTKYKSEKQRIDTERIKIIQRRDELRFKIQQIRERNQMLRAEHMQRQEQYRIMNMEYLRNMVMGVRYQNGMDIDPDNMTYEELLQLQEKMGSVSKGLTEEQIEKLPKKTYKEGDPEQLCSICYYNAKQGQQMTILPCKHTFHTECIKQWLVKQKMCPMCKQEIITKIQSSKKLDTHSHSHVHVHEKQEIQSKQNYQSNNIISNQQSEQPSSIKSIESIMRYKLSQQQIQRINQDQDQNYQDEQKQQYNLQYNIEQNFCNQTDRFLQNQNEFDQEQSQIVMDNYRQ